MLNKGLDPKHRVPYLGGDERIGVNLSSISTDEFKDLLKKRINFFCNKDYDRMGRNAPGTMFIFGAPGIGKSTIPREVVMEYNKNKEVKDKIALISVNCACINPGDFLGVFPRETPEGKELLKDLQQLDQKGMLQQFYQHVADTAPQSWIPSWLPCYKPTDNKQMDVVYDDIVNCGKMKKSIDVLSRSTKTGSGGIILFDEFWGAKPSVFNVLMNFLLERRLGEWKLGSKWFIIACSRRPCDDKESAEGWAQFSGAARNRWTNIYHLDPDPKQWKEWARKKGFDETLLNFIFDESSMEGKEYTRWHRIDPDVEDNVYPITPRTWMRANNELIKFMKYHKNEDRFKDGFSISKMTPEEIQITTSGKFSNDFINELNKWLKLNCHGIVLDKIVKDPVGAKLKKGKNNNENIDEATVMNTLLSQIKSKYGKNGKEEITDEVLSNIMIWIGQNLPEKFNVVFPLLNQFNTIFFGEENNKNNIKHFWDYHKFGILCLAAFPEYDYIKTITYKPLLEALCDKNHGKSEFHLEKPDPIELHETVKSFAEKYFTWRLDGGKLDLISKKETTTLGKDIDENPEDYVTDPEVIKKISEDIVEN